jgi:hypothetical protein
VTAKPDTSTPRVGHAHHLIVQKAKHRCATLRPYARECAGMRRDAPACAMLPTLVRKSVLCLRIPIRPLVSVLILSFRYLIMAAPMCANMRQTVPAWDSVASIDTIPPYFCLTSVYGPHVDAQASSHSCTRRCQSALVCASLRTFAPYCASL